MVGTGEDLQNGINRKQVKAGKGVFIFWKKKKRIFRGSYKEKNEEGGPRAKILGDFKF